MILSLMVVVLPLVPAGFAPDASALPAQFEKTSPVGSLSAPIAIEFLPDGRALIAEKHGRILIADVVSPAPTKSTVLTITDIASDAERGVLGLAADPGYGSNGYFYVYYTHGSTANARVSRFKVVNGVAPRSSEFVVWQDTAGVDNDYHWGGGLDFGPDGKLYLTLGDMWDSPTASQDLSLAAGKVLRLNTNGTVPSNNPFVSTPGALPEIWALGLRNPFRSKWDIASGRFFIGEVGGNRDNEPDISYEDVHLGSAGSNFGWPACEGPELPSRSACDPPSSQPSNYSAPLYSYSHEGENRSIIGGFVYRGTAFPASYRGAYFYADYSDGYIHYLTFNANGSVASNQSFDEGAWRIVDLAQGPDGALYYLSIAQGKVWKIAHTAGSSAPSISDTSATPTSGSAPLAVSFAATAVSPTGSPLTYSWDFGDGSSGAGSTVNHTYNDNGIHQARVTVSDGTDTVVSSPLEISVGSAPTATITQPITNSTFQAGDVISFLGTGSDPDETLDPADFEWTVEFFHNEHTHPVTTTTGPGGSITVPTAGHDYHDETGYEIILKVTDSSGLSHQTSVRVHPDKADLAVTSSPVGAVISLDSLPLSTPLVHDTAIDFNHTVSAPNSFCVGPQKWDFESWSDGGPQEHVVTVGANGLNLTASYRASGQCLLPPGRVLALEGDSGLAQSGGAVARWTDQSGNGNDLTTVKGNPTVGSAPSGAPAVDFDGTVDSLERVGGLNGLPADAAPRSVFLVAEYRDTGWGGFAYGQRFRNRTFGTVVSAGGNYAVQKWGAPDFESTVRATNQGWAVQSAIYDGATLSHFVGGNLIGTASHTFDTEPDKIVLGAELDGSPQLNMSVAAVLVYDRALSAPERSQVEAYLTAKYLAGGNSGDTQPPVVSGGQTFTVAASASNGSTVGVVAATDNVGITGFALAGTNPNTPFSIGNTGTLTVADSSQLVAGQSYLLIIEAVDAAGNLGSASATVTIDGTGPPPPPTGSCPTTMALGDLRSGVAARDTATGTGWIMWTQQSTHTRFNPKPYTLNADHLIAVVYQNGQWHVDNNSTLTAFTPEPTDCLVATIDYTNDTAATLQGQNTTINGMNAGYNTGNLTVTPNNWGTGTNNGEFGTTGTQLNTTTQPPPTGSCPTTMALGDLRSGVAARDTATGTGWIMWTQQSTHTRFNPKPYTLNADHLIAVVYQNGQWHVDNNSTLTAFTPEPTDCLVATIDYTNDTAATLQGQNTTINGMNAGYNTGNLTVTPNNWGTGTNNGEFGTTGTQLNTTTQPPPTGSCPTTMALGDLRSGVAARDTATGTGWIMWTQQSTHTRFNPKPYTLNADHLIAVVYQNGQWHVDNNSTLTAFTPEPTDCLVATIDYTNDTAATLQGQNTTINGMNAGYNTGNLTVTPNNWGTGTNNGEFGTTGTQLNT